MRFSRRSRDAAATSSTALSNTSRLTAEGFRKPEIFLMN
jgi:hypothetical protein